MADHLSRDDLKFIGDVLEELRNGTAPEEDPLDLDSLIDRIDREIEATHMSFAERKEGN